MTLAMITPVQYCRPLAKVTRPTFGMDFRQLGEHLLYTT